MRLYELVLVLKPSISEVNRKKLLETIKGWLASAKITKEEELGQKVLTYPIRHEQAGVFFLWNFEAETMTPDFERRIIQNEDILRHLLIRTK